MAPVIAVLALGLILFWLLWSEMSRQEREPDLPRERRLLLLQKFGEELGLWPAKDVFGLGHPHHLLPPESPPPEYVVPLTAVLQQRVTREIEEQAPKTPLKGV